MEVTHTVCCKNRTILIVPQPETDLIILLSCFLLMFLVSAGGNTVNSCFALRRVHDFPI